MRNLINDIRLKDWRTLILNTPDIANSIHRLPISSYNDMEISVINEVHSNAELGSDYDAVIKARQLPLVWGKDKFRIGLMPGIENRKYYPVILVIAAWKTNTKQNMLLHPVVLGVIKDPSVEKIRVALSECKEDGKFWF